MTSAPAAEPAGSPAPVPAPPTATPTGAARRRPATVAVTAGRPAARPNAPLSEPVTFTSTYVASPGGDQPGDLVYARWANPTWTALEDALGELEGGRALVFGSGLAAVAAVIGQVPTGGTVICPNTAYNGTLAQLGALADAGHLRLRPVDVTDTTAVVAALPGADLLWLESPTNPLLEIADLPALCAAARAVGVPVAVDNTFATPLLQRPLEHGADVVVHSVTKYLSGHSDVLLGAVVTAALPPAEGDSARFGHEALLRHRTLHGAIAGPMEAWLALRGLRTLHLRVERSAANAIELAHRLAAHPAVAAVRHPALPDHPQHERARQQLDGFGSIVCFEPNGGAAQADRICAAVRLWVHTTSLGGVESTLERRRRHTSEPTTVPPGLIRLSVGVEDVEDLWADLDAAITASV